MPDITKTRDELINRAARKAVLIASGQTLEAEDGVVIDEAIDGVLADLAGRDVVYVADPEAIDINIFEWLADILADTVAPDFGKQRDPNKVLFAEQMLKTVTAARPTYEVLRTEYF